MCVCVCVCVCEYDVLRALVCLLVMCDVLRTLVGDGVGARVLSTLVPSVSVLSECVYLCACVCACVCVCEREGERSNDLDLDRSLDHVQLLLSFALYPPLSRATVCVQVCKSASP